MHIFNFVEIPLGKTVISLRHNGYANLPYNPYLGVQAVLTKQQDTQII